MAKTIPENNGNEWPADPQALRVLITERVHPAADKVPLWPLSKLLATAEILKTIGRQIDPVYRLKGTGEIIDGRNAWLCARMASLKPRFVTVVLPEGVTPELFVELRNVVRRQLNRDQLAAFAAERYPSLRQEGILRRKQNLLKQDNSIEVEKIPLRASGSSLAFLSALFSVNRRYIQDATIIMEENPALFGRIKAGEITLQVARRSLGLIQPRPPKKLGSSPASGSTPDGTGNGGIASGSTSGAKGTGGDLPVRRLQELVFAIEQVYAHATPKLKPKLEGLKALATAAKDDFGI